MYRNTGTIYNECRLLILVTDEPTWAAEVWQTAQTRMFVYPEVEFREKSSNTVRSVIEPCFKKAGYEPYLRTGFFLDLFLYHERQVTNTAQSVININSIKPGIPVFIGKCEHV